MIYSTRKVITRADGRPYLVFIAGPYRSETVAGIARNVAAARSVAERVWQLGGVAVCPHLMTAYMDGLVPDRCFLDGALELMRRCDVVLVFGEWERSEGTMAEIEEAMQRSIPVFSDPDLLAAMIGGTSAEPEISVEARS